jgi:excisionase family DNA binding protein
MDINQPLTLTVEQTAKLLGIGRSTAYELVRTGDIPSLRLGRRILVPSSYILSATAYAPTIGHSLPSDTVPQCANAGESPAGCDSSSAPSSSSTLSSTSSS